MFERYLPSRKFSLIFSSILLSAFLVWIANFTTQPFKMKASLNTIDGQNPSHWAAALTDIQASQTNRLPTPQDQDTVNSLLEGAQTDNITDSIGRSLLINVTNAQAQGLGADEPTQNQLVSAALAQLDTVAKPSRKYTYQDMKVVQDSYESVKAYANALVPVLKKHPHASVAETYIIFGEKINGQNNDLSRLNAVAKEYRGLASDYVRIPVPQSLQAYHLQIANDYIQMADSFSHMQEVSTDPMRGLAGLKLFSDTTNDAQSMFINITQIFAKDGILFTKDDPGAELRSMLSGQ